MEALDVNAPSTLINIEKMQKIYGAEKLNSMSSSEFYKLYKHHNTGTSM